jgi:GNAT superfamily N-acetyltransferase
MSQSALNTTVSTVRFRRAEARDLKAIVGMLADDPLGAQRERPAEPLLPAYVAAFEAIDRDPNIELIVAEDSKGMAIAVLQLTFTPFMTHQGAWRANIEGVRVARDRRRSGLGRQLLAWAIDRARQRNCDVVQLTTDKQRTDAQHFYTTLGFVATHEGMKLKLKLDLS